MRCRCCRRKQSNRPRRLCWTCYYTPGVRDRFPTISKFGRRGVANGFRPHVLPPAPTSARPKSPEKLAVLESRAAMGTSLWHPLDA